MTLDDNGSTMPWAYFLMTATLRESKGVFDMMNILDEQEQKYF